MNIARLIWTLRDGEYHTSKDIANDLGIPREQAVNLVKYLVEYNGGIVDYTTGKTHSYRLNGFDTVGSLTCQDKPQGRRYTPGDFLRVLEHVRSKFITEVLEVLNENDYLNDEEFAEILDVSVSQARKRLHSAMVTTGGVLHRVGPNGQRRFKLIGFRQRETTPAPVAPPAPTPSDSTKLLNSVWR